MSRLSAILIIITLAVSNDIAFGQGVILRGKVTDAESGEPIIGATIVEQDEDQRILNGTVTNVNGDYSIEVSGPGARIVFSSIGYKSETVELGAQERINMAMESEYIQIEAAEVVAQRRYVDPITGITDRDRTGSAVSLDLDPSTTAGITSVEDAMQGQLSGVEIMGSGDPGAGGSIVIRGLGTLGNSAPLIVVDGIPQDVNVSGDLDFSTADVEDISSLVSIAPQDIKSLVVLKDAATLAIWGSRGANGVIQIETKKGMVGKTKFTYQSKLIQEIPRPPIPMLNGDEYIMLQLEERHAPTGIYEVPPELSGDIKLLGEDFYNYTQNTDWLDAVTQTGYGMDHHLSLNGGGERTNYYGSINYLDQTGTTINTAYKRITSRVNFNYKISKNLTLESSISYINSLREDNYTSSSSSSNIRSMALRKAPNMSIYKYDGEGNLTDEFFTPIRSYQGSGRSYYNPVAMGMLSSDDDEENRVESKFVLNYKIIPGVRFLSTISYTYLNSKRNRFRPYNSIGVDWLDDDNNYARENDGSVNRILTRNQLMFNPSINKNHVISAIILFETNEEISDYFESINSRTASVLLNDPATNGQFRSINSSSFVERSVGSFAQVFYSFRDKYLATVNARLDGASELGADNRWGLFPSASLAWRFSEEPFLKRLPYMDDSKFRVSYGVTGNLNRLRAYSRHATYGSVSGLPNQYSTHSALYPKSIQLDKVKWETVAQWNVGVDLAMFKRLDFTFDVYDKLTSDILMRNYDIPSSSGYGSLGFFNGGKVRNQGWEALLRFTPVRNENFRVRLNFNISHNVNTYLEFPDNFNAENSVALGNGEYPRRANLGEPIGSFYGLQWLGVYKDAASVVARNADGEIIYDANGQPLNPIYTTGFEFGQGDAIYADQNSDGVIDLLDVVYLGDANPEFEGGFGLQFSYKKIFSARFNFHGRYGFEIVNLIASETQGMSDRNNQSTAVLKRWRKPGDDFEGILPRAYYNHPANNLGSDRFVEDGSYLRFNSMTLEYSFPARLARRIGMDRLELAWSMRKIYTWTNYTGQDPEIRRSADPFWMGADEGRTPVPMRNTLSLVANF
jgi:TonB-linked SusC/RagA family outer membrane protein